MSEQASDPPISLRALAERVDRRLREAGVTHAIRFVAPNDVSSWQLAVDVPEGCVNLIFASHHSDKVAVVSTTKRKSRSKWPQSSSQ